MTLFNRPSTPNNAVKNQNNQHFIKHIFELIYCEAGFKQCTFGCRRISVRVDLLFTWK
ncbi:hypothetical protein Hanom_Chr02g00140321 [Helianthus anomalus]